eukprot:TRINITY_DN43395_c0_g1_i1.p1 TRINITY_DN43395_c0_g1~~TRINITY_DN43395_c0_g1_i1.p1  ORF type:complete len:137 (-),score=20.35 TRINITY_DN43395_c0_g1_i1:303-713(-)
MSFALGANASARSTASAMEPDDDKDADAAGQRSEGLMDLRVVINKSHQAAAQRAHGETSQHHSSFLEGCLPATTCGPRLRGSTGKHPVLNPLSSQDVSGVFPGIPYCDPWCMPEYSGMRQAARNEEHDCKCTLGAP